MTEGGLFAWKRQVIDTSRGPTTSYDGLHRALPPPPKDMHWVHDEKTREWSLEKQNDGNVPVAIAVPIDGQTTDMMYYEHKVQPTDTFQGICLKYKITPTELRRQNCFSGSNLLLAPNPLRIPRTKDVAIALEKQRHGTQTQDQKIEALLMKCSGLARTEAKCFLELNDWKLQEAVEDACASAEENVDKSGGF